MTGSAAVFVIKEAIIAVVPTRRTVAALAGLKIVCLAVIACCISRLDEIAKSGADGCLPAIAV